MEQDKEQQEAPSEMPQWFVQYALQNQREHHELGLKIAEANQRAAEMETRLSEKIAGSNAELQRQAAENYAELRQEAAKNYAEMQRQYAEVQRQIAAQTRWIVGSFSVLLTLFIALDRVLG